MNAAYQAGEFDMKKPQISSQCLSHVICHVLTLTAYKKTLEEAIQSDTSGLFCRILVSLVQVRENSDCLQFPHPHFVDAVLHEFDKEQKCWFNKCLEPTKKWANSLLIHLWNNWFVNSH